MLDEAMKTPADIPVDGRRPLFIVNVDGSPQSSQITITLSTRGSTKPGDLGILVAKRDPKMPMGPCSGAWEVSWAKATPGWGPLMYNVMLELVGDSGLTPDRSSVSEEALGVWSKFIAGESPGVENKQLDDMYDTVTPAEDDNCVHRSSREHFGREPHERDYETKTALRAARLKWLESSPLTKVYKKKPGSHSWITDLIKMGAYYENGALVTPQNLG
jgi:hypothetical protein